MLRIFHSQYLLGLVFLLNTSMIFANIHANLHANHVIKNKIARSAQIIKINPASPTLILTLKSNPSTGYHWQLVHYDSQFLTLISQAYQPPNSKLMGAPGHEILKFKINFANFQKINHTHIFLKYLRPWEPKKPARELHFTIVK